MTHVGTGAMRGTARIIQGDARALPLPDASVDLICTSPPYYGQRSYTDGGEHYEGQIGDEDTVEAYIDGLIDATQEMVRVLKPSGSIWVNLGDKYAARGGHSAVGRTSIIDGSRRVSQLTRGPERNRTGVPLKSLVGLPWRYALRCIDELGMILRAEVIWSKNGLPESVQDRVRRSHEQWFHLTVQPRYYSAVDEIREDLADRSPHAMSRRARTDARLAAAGAGMVSAAHPLGKLPGSVWEIPTQPLKVPEHLGVDHFAAFPMEWPRRIIRGWCPPGGRVLDPFGGTGTTALVAKALGRHGISVDMSGDYCRLAQWRTTDPGEHARALQVPKPPQQIDGQGVLL